MHVQGRNELPMDVHIPVEYDLPPPTPYTDSPVSKPVERKIVRQSVQSSKEYEKSSVGVSTQIKSFDRKSPEPIFSGKILYNSSSSHLYTQCNIIYTLYIQYRRSRSSWGWTKETAI